MSAQLSILELYDSHVEWYKAKRNLALMEKKYLDAVVADIKLKSSKTILDLGCGIGQPIAQYLFEQGLDVTGVDGSENMIKKSKELNPKGRWIKADMRTLDLNEKFDALLAWDSFFHLTQDEQKKMFPIFEKHLNPGGVLLFTSGTKAGVAVGEMNGYPLFHSSLSTEEYHELLAQNGFTVLDHQIEDPECGKHTVWRARKTS